MINAAEAETLRAVLKQSGLPRRLPFAKMEGLGNDYVYMEEFDSILEATATLARLVSNRHFGIGGDGLVLLSRSKRADFRMRMFNADGSEGEMCGNAARCIGKYLYERKLTGKHEITLETLAGIRILRLEVKNGLVASVTVDMGEPRLAPADIPMLSPGDNFIDSEITVGGRIFRGTAVSMGNPHLVVPVEDLDSLPLSALGPLFEHHPMFPKRVNTEFVEIPAPERIRMRVWERGSGETLACGTGACAALAACALNNLTGRKAAVELRGGNLFIEWDDDNIIHMAGPANFVFVGEYTVW